MVGSNLDRVLNCPNLPSLPGAALAILEQTKNPYITLEQIAKTIQTDPALATKVLRTVNSSYYGLSQPCSTIARALGFLGLTTVKSVVLGFSLVDNTNKVAAGGGFDLAAYWRRAVYAAAGARLVAETTKAADKDEAFLGALVQDIGMLAAFAALGEAYTQVLREAGPDHDKLPAAEMTALGFTHQQAGSQLAQKWHLPEQIAASIRHHHNADKAPPSCEGLARAVGMGGILAGILTVADRAEKLTRLVDCGQRWFSLGKEQTLALVGKTAERGNELAKAMEVKTGETPDVAAILGEASEAQLAHQAQMQRETATLRQTSEDLARQTVTDAMTGAFNRKHFDAESARLLEGARAGKSAVGLLFIDADKFKSVNDTHGHKAGDAVLVELARRMRETVGDAGTVCRYGGEEFGVLLPGRDTAGARQIAEKVRAAMAGNPIDVRGTGAKADTVTVTVSVGVAAIEPPPNGAAFASPTEFVQAADHAVYAAKRSGRNRVCAHGDPETKAVAGEAAKGPPPAAAAAPVTVMLVEDDPLASHLMEVLLIKRKGAKVVRMSSAEDALRALGVGTAGGGGVPDLIICDCNLPGMSGEAFVQIVRQKGGESIRAVPLVMLSGSHQAEDRAKCMAAGASAYVTKAEFARDLDGWVSKLVGLVGRAIEVGAAPTSMARAKAKAA